MGSYPLLAVLFENSQLLVDLMNVLSVLCATMQWDFECVVYLNACAGFIFLVVC